MRFVRWRWLILAVVVLAGASCNDGEFPDEGDVPQEALVVMPGATVVESKFKKGRTSENVDGGVSYFTSVQTVVYEIDGVTGLDVYEFYLNELSDKGWVFYAVDGNSQVEGGVPGECRIGGGGRCGTFEFLGPGGNQKGRIGVIHSMRLSLYSGLSEAGYPLGVEHIDDEIDGFKISILLGFAPSESCEDWDGPAWGTCVAG